MALRQRRPRPPLLLALEVERAQRQAAAAGWRIAATTPTAPPAMACPGPLRVIRQTVVAPHALALVVAAAVVPPDADAAALE